MEGVLNSWDLVYEKLLLIALGNFIEYNSRIKEVCTKLIMWIWILKHLSKYGNQKLKFHSRRYT